MTGIVEAIRAEIPQYVAAPVLKHQRQLETQLGNPFLSTSRTSRGTHCRNDTTGIRE